MPTQQTRYLCRTCDIEFVDGSWILADGGGRLGGRPWTFEDGCVKCRSAVERVVFTPSVPGLDIPRDVGQQPLALVSKSVESCLPRPLVDRGHNDILAPGEGVPNAAPPSVDYADIWQWI